MYIGKILIVKTSSLGDIIQAMGVLEELRLRFPRAQIDWVVEERFKPIVEAHPLVRRAIPFSLKSFRFDYVTSLRKERYDLLFDLQGNTKSGLATLLARSRKKIGFGRRSVREWPNILATQIRFEVPLTLNIRDQHSQLLNHFFQDALARENRGVCFAIDKEAERLIERLLSAQTSPRIMVCPGSKWMNKQLPLATWIEFLSQIKQTLNASFLLMWGSSEEKAFCEEIRKHIDTSLVVDQLPVPVWQNLMNKMDLVIAVDSAALHLAGTTQTPTFSLFGPTSLSVFKPTGPRHFALQGSCPYNVRFEKTCPKLRTCPSGACIRELASDPIFQEFIHWWKSLKGLK
ncbi:MAG TPA: glycosyltransferase family 9 protein [Chlamydiales bacterium]